MAVAGKVANGMDSVFDLSAQNELDYDVMFDDEDTIIDTIAGVDEAGVPLTGPDYDWDAFFESVDDNFDVSDVSIPEDEKYNAEKNGDQAATPAQANGVKDAPLVKGGELGNNSMTPDSAEAHAYDDTKKINDAIGANDSQQTRLKEDASEGPLEDDDEAERAGETSDTAINTESVINAVKNRRITSESLGAKIKNALDKRAVLEQQAYDMIVDKVIESMSSEELQSENVQEIIEDKVDAVKARILETAEAEGQVCPDCGKNPCECAVNEDTDPIADKCDCGLRDGDIKLSSDNTEGVGQDIPGKAIDGSGSSDKGDSIIDLDDEDAREGEVQNDKNKVEGVDTKVVGAALEAVMDKILEEMDPIEDLDDTDARDGEIAPDQKNNTEGKDQDVIGAALETVEDLLSDVGDKDDIDLESISNNDKIVPDDIRESFSYSFLDEESQLDKLTSDEDDVDDLDIEAIDNNDDGSDPDLNYAYDDDELIDLVASGNV